MLVIMIEMLSMNLESFCSLSGNSNVKHETSVDPCSKKTKRNNKACCLVKIDYSVPGTRKLSGEIL